MMRKHYSMCDMIYFLAVMLILSLTACSKADVETIEVPIRNSDTEQDQISLSIELFCFVQSAFECGKEVEKTRVMAVADSSIDTTGIKLIAACEKNGDRIELTDDGKGADTIAGDHVFYGPAEFSSETEMTLSYTLISEADEVKLEARYSTDVRFYTLESFYEERDLGEVIMDDLDRIASEFVYDESQDIEILAENYLQVCGKMTSYLNEQVEKGNIVSYDWNLPEFTISFPLGEWIYTFGEYDEGIKAGAGTVSSTGSNGRGHSGGPGREDPPEGELPAILMLPYDDELSSDGYREAMDDFCTNFEGASCRIKGPGDVTPELLKELEYYRIIVFSTHGGSNEKDGPSFSINIPFKDITPGDYTNKRLIVESKSGGIAKVTSAFFDEYYEDGSLNDCLIYIGCCHMADDNRMKDVLLRKGARAVLCYTNTVSDDYDNAMIRSLFSYLMEYEKNGSGLTLTVKEALEKAKQDNGDKCDLVKYFKDRYQCWVKLFDYIANGLGSEMAPIITPIVLGPPAELILFENEKESKPEFRLIDKPSDSGEKDTDTTEPVTEAPVTEPPITEAPTTEAPTTEVGSGLSAVAGYYAKYLRDHQDLLEMTYYTQHYYYDDSIVSYPNVAFYDVTGDGIPEMLLICRNPDNPDATMSFRVITADANGAREILKPNGDHIMNQFWDHTFPEDQADTVLFIKDSTLYFYREGMGGGLEYSYEKEETGRLTAQRETGSLYWEIALEWRKERTPSSSKTLFQAEEKDIDEAAYYARKAELLEAADVLIFYGMGREHTWSAYEALGAETGDYISMTLWEALELLEPGSEMPTAETRTGLSAAAGHYADYIRAHWDMLDMAYYSRYYLGGDESYRNTPNVYPNVAFYDVTEDGIPEMLLVCRDLESSYDIMCFRIITCDAGGAQEICKPNGDKIMNVFWDQTFVHDETDTVIFARNSTLFFYRKRIGGEQGYYAEEEEIGRLSRYGETDDLYWEIALEWEDKGTSSQRNILFQADGKDIDEMTYHSRKAELLGSADTFVLYGMPHWLDLYEEVHSERSDYISMTPSEALEYLDRLR